MNPQEQGEAIARIETTMDLMYQRLFGNGQPGELALIHKRIGEVDERVDGFDKDKSYVKGIIAVLALIISLVGGTEIYHLFRPEKSYGRVYVDRPRPSDQERQPQDNKIQGSRVSGTRPASD